MTNGDRKADLQDVNQQIYALVLQREEQRKRDLARRKRKSLEVLGMLFGVGIIVTMIIAGTAVLLGA